MKINLFNLPSLITVASCIAFVSCYPIVTGHRPPNQNTDPNTTTISSGEQQTIEQKREILKKRELERQATLERQANNSRKKLTTPPKKPDIKKPVDYAFATPVPGKEGFVFSPYNNKLVDVRDIPSGTLVKDPTYAASEKKYFRVP